MTSEVYFHSDGFILKVPVVFCVASSLRPALLWRAAIILITIKQIVSRCDAEQAEMFVWKNVIKGSGSRSWTDDFPLWKQPWWKHTGCVCVVCVCVRTLPDRHEEEKQSHGFFLPHSWRTGSGGRLGKIRLWARFGTVLLGWVWFCLVSSRVLTRHVFWPVCCWIKWRQAEPFFFRLNILQSSVT